MINIRSEVVAQLSRKSALYLDHMCVVLQAYPKKWLKLYTPSPMCSFATQYIDNGYFVVKYNVITGVTGVEPCSGNVVLNNYIQSLGIKEDYLLRNLEELEKFCETAKFIGGMGDEH